MSFKKEWDSASKPDLRELDRKNPNKVLDESGNAYLDLLVAENAPLSKIKKWVARGADINQTNNYNVSAVLRSIGLADKETVKYLLSIPTQPPILDKADENYGMAAIHCAVLRGEKEVLDLVLKAGADKDATLRAKNKMTPLHMAIDLDFPQLIAPLIEAGADVNAYSPKEKTPLHLAAEKGYSECVRELLKQGADYNKVPLVEMGVTPLHMSIKNDHVEATRLLLENGSDPNLGYKVDNKSYEFHVPPLNHAAIFNSPNVIPLLVEYGAVVDARDNTDYRFTPLMEAAHHGFEHVVYKLLDRGANPFLQNHEGLTPQEISRNENNHGTSRILEEAEDLLRSKFYPPKVTNKTSGAPKP